MAKKKLTDIPGIGRVTAADLQKAGFQSLESLAKASAGAIEAVRGFGAIRAARIKKVAGDLVDAAAATVGKAASPNPAEDAGKKKQRKKGGKSKPKKDKPKKDKPPKGKKKDKKKKKKDKKKGRKKRKKK